MYERHNLGGTQVKYCGVTTEGPKKLKDKQALQLGFDFIKEHSPRDKTDNEVVVWVECQINDDQSPKL